MNSPTLLKLTTIKRDLSQCLQEEKRQSKPTKASATNQFASSRTSETNSVNFVAFESLYVIIEDGEGLHCPIYKEYPLQWSKDESSAHFKVPRLPYPIFYWESPLGQCPFIPPLANDSSTQANRKSSQLTRQSEKNKTTLTAAQDLRARALRNSAASKAPQITTPKLLFEPAMTDTSILTAKTNLTRHNRIGTVNNNAIMTNGQRLPHPHRLHNPVLKITPNFSVNVNRATVSATTPKQTKPTEDQQPALQCSRKKEKSAASAQHRARPGFCECCCEKYSDLEKHVKEPLHRQFALQSDNYEGIDNFLNGLKRPFKAEYMYYKNNNSNENNDNCADNSLLLLDTSMIQNNSPISPTTTHITTNARNYTETKKLKQSLASKRIKMIANTTTSSILDEEDAEASGVVEVLSTVNNGGNAATKKNTTNNNNHATEVNYISSPSCKRRKSFKLVQ